jgi:hypothetical protein
MGEFFGKALVAYKKANGLPTGKLGRIGRHCSSGELRACRRLGARGCHRIAPSLEGTAGSFY